MFRLENSFGMWYFDIQFHFYFFEGLVRTEFLFFVKFIVTQNSKKHYFKILFQAVSNVNFLIRNFMFMF